MNVVELVAALAVTGAAAVFAFWAVKKYDRRRARAWQQACARLGPPFVEDEGGAAVDVEVAGGRIQGADASRRVYSAASGLHPHQAGYYIIGVPSGQLPPHFVADVQGVAIGGPQLQLGDPDFDREVVVGSSDHEAVRRFLGAGRRAALRRFFAAVPDARISSDRIVISADGRPDAGRLHMQLAATRDLLAALADGDGEHRPGRGA